MLPEKTCATCGRPFAWRRAWADDWEQVRYCSKGCRTRRPNRTDRALEEALLAALGSAHEVGPDHAARMVGGEHWRGLTERARRAARRLAAEGRVDLVRDGRPVGPNASGRFAVRAR